MAGRLLLVCGTLLVLVGEVARGEGKYQSTRDGKTLVWNNHPTPGDVATRSGARDSDDHARGYGQLTWYTKERGFVKPQFYAHYWGRMVGGKFEGPVNVHAKRKTHYAIFIDGRRMTGWTRGAAPTLATRRWLALVAKRRTNVEPESPAAGPVDQRSEDSGQRSDAGWPMRARGPSSTWNESIQDLWSDRWPKIDIDDSLRVLALPPRSLRVKR